MWTWVKIPKGIALAAFLLPWVTVSCSGKQLVSATGWQLATGHASILNPITGEATSQSGDVNVALVLALVAIVAGLALSFRPARGAAIPVLATSILALLLNWFATRDLTNDTIARKAAEKSDGRFDAAMASLIHIDWQAGYWIANGALIVATVIAAMTLSGKSVSVNLRSDPPPSA